MKKEWCATIVSNETRGKDFKVLKCEVENFPDVKGGEFLMLSAEAEPYILLRRPMAIYDITRSGSKSVLSILYQVMGRGTQAMSERVSGEDIHFLAPLGNYFEAPKPNEKIAVVAGGIGIAPFLSWIKMCTLEQRKNIRLFFGFRFEHQAEIISDFKAVGVHVEVACDQESSIYFNGNAVDLFLDSKESVQKVYTCGPNAMMKALHTKCGDLPVYASLEAKMACGMGVCLSCVTDFPLDPKYGHQPLVCTKGPVFLM